MSGRSEALRGAFRERLRPLRDTHRELLMRAAVLGREFDADVLAELSAAPAAGIAAALRTATRLQVIEPVDATSRRFRFRHALTRDAMYDELVAAHLRPLHRAIGEALERLASRRHTELDELAYHWWAAGDPARGVRYNEDAGDRAGALHAGDDALRYYARVLELATSDGSVRKRILKKIATLHATLRPSTFD